MMSGYVNDVYMNCWSWHVHGSHLVCLLKPGVIGGSFGIRCYSSQIISSSWEPSAGRILNITLPVISLSWGPSAEKTPNNSPFAVLDRFFITSLIHEKYKGFKMPKVRKTPSLSLSLKTNIKFTSLTGPPISQYARLGGLPSSPAGLYKQTSWWEIITNINCYITIVLLEIFTKDEAFHITFRTSISPSKCNFVC